MNKLNGNGRHQPHMPQLQTDNASAPTVRLTWTAINTKTNPSSTAPNCPSTSATRCRTVCPPPPYLRDSNKPTR